MLAVVVAAIGLVAAGIVLCDAVRANRYSAFGGAFLQGGFSTVFSEIIVIATLLATLTLGLGVGRDDQVAGSTALLDLLERQRGHIDDRRR